MELYEVGHQCARPDCKQLDYLPFHCQLCTHYYCVEHKSFKDHIDCTPPSSASPSSCPSCNQPVNGTSPYNNASENESLITKHIQDGCLTPMQELKLRKSSKRCMAVGCRKDSVVGCNGCAGKYCTGHRLREGHGCKSGVPSGMKAGNGSGNGLWARGTESQPIPSK
ncbi:hypothetical protein BCR33DRAFT_717760 [Rhizoclosmatium globosum]|uniref:AN1-type domain-containing protein n=1 Tax=Rhizoclosmatium globosum TaxID=329046 RepID=A0A1Y2C7M6_9FUNG|nr:hypothetical protein BCR33DRAFT_717760 [Rhizoclosmatium globosum]|eukprot:ORY43031.1 hypothetical protein BCR33DRAFT_717760 [Rhizoclosmatium globosum]